MYVSIFQKKKKKNYSQNKNKLNVAVNVPGLKFVCFKPSMDSRHKKHLLVWLVEIYGYFIFDINILG